MRTVDLSKYDNSWYNTGANTLKRTLWYFINILFIMNPLLPISCIKVWVLRMFGAEIGKNVVIKPSVNIKYPWNLKIGDNTWIGEKVWLDNLVQISIGSNCCISQGAMLLCGNHNYKKETFDLIVDTITIEDGCWIGAKAMVCPGVTMRTHSMLSVMSVAKCDTQAYGVFCGNPAIKIREREIKS